MSQRFHSFLGAITLKKISMIASVFVLAAASGWAAQGTPLPLRIEPGGTCIYGETTPQTLESGYGSSAQALSFSGTSVFSFYSPAIISAPNLTASDKCGGQLWFTNGSAQSFNATIRFEFLDYDSSTGSEVLLADSGESPSTRIARLSMSKVAAPHGAVGPNPIVTPGHLLHVRVTVNVSGTAANAAIVLNGAEGSKADSLALFPQQTSSNWVFDAPSSAPDVTITAGPSAGANSIGNLASVSVISGAAYAWSVAGGTITAGQGTSQITWTAGSIDQATLSVTVTKGCSSLASANVTIVTTASVNDCRLLSISCTGGNPAHIIGTGKANSPYLIQASEDLVTWQDVGNVVADTANSFTFDDPDSGAFSARFYRAVAP